MLKPARVTVLACVAASIAIGCGGDTGPGCTATACNITDAHCQKSIFAATACEREQSGASEPKVRVLTLDQFRQELDADPSEPTASERGWGTVFQLLRLLPAGQSIDQAATNTAADNIAAYYSTSTKGVTVIDRGSSDEQEDLFTLSHEFVHSLQDEEVGLAAFQKKWTHSTESSIAVKALIEGEAVLVSAGVLTRSLGRERSGTDWPRFESALFTSIFGSLDKSAAPFFAAVENLPYPIGSDGLVEPWLSRGQPGIEDFYSRPYLSLIDWVDDVPRPQTEVEPLTCYPTSAPAGYVGEDHDTFGIAGVLSMFMRAGLDAESSYGASRGWRSDSVVTFRPSDTTDDHRAVAWRTHWATPDDALAFRGAVSGVPALRIVLEEQNVTLFAASDTQILAQWDTTPCGVESDLPTSTSDTMTMMSKIRGSRWR
jgi:hypothetical protein